VPRDSQVALVTGASSGMGKAIAKALLASGRQVFAAARSVERMQDLAALGAVPVGLDLADPASIDAAADRVGSVQILINNAGFGLYGAVEDLPIAEARRQFEVNLFGPARLTQLLLPGMRAAGRGWIVNISSMGGRIYTPLGAWYHASKHAIEGWSDCLRIELAPFGIHVVVVEPGIIGTGFGDVLIEPMLQRSAGGAYASLAEAVAAATRATYARGKASDPQVVADAVLRAVGSNRPRTRYAVGKHARSLMLLRRLVGDRNFARIILGQVRVRKRA
jgi:NAD(P)-dependent dehydrogenase (short-subunit alcohol dehydrogenase family)